MRQASRLLTVLVWVLSVSGGAVQNLKELKFDNVTYMDMLSRRAMKRMHDDLDNDDDGNVSISEGVEFLAGHKDLLKNTGENGNLPGFVTDIDGRITELEFWDSWIKSSVHNWTNAEILSWLKYEVEMPQYAPNFQGLNISGAAFPILACNSTIVSALVEGSKENKLKLMLKAKEIVLFGPSKQKSSWMKDALLTFSLALAICGIAFGMQVQRNANRTIIAIQDKMKSLQSSLDKMEEDEMNWRARDVTRPDDDCSAGSNSAESEDSMVTTFSVYNDELMVQGKLAQVMRELDSTKEALRNAEKQLQKRQNDLILPSDLLTKLQITYQVETRLFEMKKKHVYDNVERTKQQFQKIERNRSTFLGILQVVHSRQVDNFDSEVQQTREEFRELQSIMKERRKRWATIEQLCKCRILPSSSRSNLSSPKTPPPELLEISPEWSNEQNSPIRKKINKARKSPLANKMKDFTQFSSNANNVPLSRTSSKKSTKSLPLTLNKPVAALPSHASSPALSTHMNGHKNSEHSPRILHSESTSHISSSNSTYLLPIPEKSNQTFPKRSPQPKRRGKLTNVLDASNGFMQDSSPERDKSEKPSPSPVKLMSNKRIEDLSPLDGTKRSGSSQSLPHIQENSTSISESVLSHSSMMGESSDSLDTGAKEDEVKQNIPTVTTLDSARKSNLKKRSFFTFKKKKKP